MKKTIIPKNYSSALTLYETQNAIGADLTIDGSIGQILDSIP